MPPSSQQQRYNNHALAFVDRKHHFVMMSSFHAHSHVVVCSTVSLLIDLINKFTNLPLKMRKDRSAVAVWTWNTIAHSKAEEHHHQQQREGVS
jgi:hypothetical protein